MLSIALFLSRNLRTNIEVRQFTSGKRAKIYSYWTKDRTNEVQAEEEKYVEKGKYFKSKNC